MTTQTIFKGFGPNWKRASFDGWGRARVHTGEAIIALDGTVTEKKWGGQAAARAQAFDKMEISAEPMDNAYIVERTDFTNGPTYATDEFGIPLEPPALPAAPQVPTGFYAQPVAGGGVCSTGHTICSNGQGATGFYTPPAPTAVVHITTDEAENGELWKFAKAHEQHVMVNCFGVVWFDVSKDGGQPRRATDIMVDGVTHVIERTRSLPVPVAPPEAGVPYVDKFDAQPELSVGQAIEFTGKGDDDPEWADGVAVLEAEIAQQAAEIERCADGWENATNALTKAKERAQALLSRYYADGSQQLTDVQYMAIFGELPQ